jgi:hypothetical protein
MMLTVTAFAGDDEIGRPAPRFRAKTMTGEQLNNEFVKGKAVLFEFWTSRRKYCAAAIVDDMTSGSLTQALVPDLASPPASRLAER